MKVMQKSLVGEKVVRNIKVYISVKWRGDNDVFDKG